ncbi:MAG: TlpA disulfide reductase family protein [Alcanivorax sp.]|nr:TlpA disulfide reductase family protein [Alcanivorax sp.]
MDAIVIGPLALPAGALVVVIGLIAAIIAASRLSHGEDDVIDGTLYLMVAVALIAARVSFVIRYPEQFKGPLAMLDVRDGGWWWPGALIGALLALLLVLWRHPDQKRPLLGSTGISLATMAITIAVLKFCSPTHPPLPKTPLYTLDGRTATLADSASGATVVNLWASWCAPCVREMSVLARAEQQYPNVRFLLINEGEEIEEIQHFLDHSGLKFHYILRDPRQTLNLYSGNRGLPLTLLFDAQGNEVARHLGPLNPDGLRHFLAQLPEARP